MDVLIGCKGDYSFFVISPLVSILIFSFACHRPRKAVPDGGPAHPDAEGLSRTGSIAGDRLRREKSRV